MTTVREEQVTLAPYDAVLLVSFGGPEKPEEVTGFLQHVTGGRVPAARLAEVAEHYHHFGGRSPINDQCRELIDALALELDARGVDAPIYWGNRHSRPWLADAVAALTRDGRRRAVMVTTSAYPSYSSCRSYREDLYEALAELPEPRPVVERCRQYAQHPGFVDANVAAISEAIGRCGRDPHIVFVTHSIPEQMATTSGPEPRSGSGSYVDWHLNVAREICWRLQGETGRDHPVELAYCSRSGPPSQPWLEPDINDRLEELAAEGVDSVVLAPIGFVSDHMEVIFDLDTEAKQTAERLGLEFQRAATAGTHPAFVSALADLLLERAVMARGEPVAPQVINGGSPGLVECSGDCCPNLLDPAAPAACQRDSATR